MKQKFYAVCLATIVFVPLGAVAHDGATGVVKERMDKMKTMSESMKALAQYVKGAKPADPEDIARHAKTLHMHSGKELVSLFPQNSVTEQSEARPEIWQDWDKFEALAFDLKKEAQGLSQLVQNTDSVDGDALRQSFVNVAGTCKVCHTDYRLKKN